MSAETSISGPGAQGPGGPKFLPSEFEVLGRFDGVALAEELRAGMELLLEKRKDDPEFVAKVHAALANARVELADLDDGDEILAALTPRTLLSGNLGPLDLDELPPVTF